MAGATRVVRIEEFGDPIRVDDRDDPVDDDDQVHDEDRLEEEDVEDESDHRRAVHPQQQTGAEGDEQDRRRRERERPHGRAGIQLTQSREDQGEEGGPEWRAVPRSRLLRWLHRG